MRFWDSSALAPLFLIETSSQQVRAWYRTDPDVLVWWLSRVELFSAIARRRREDQVSPEPYRAARAQILRVWDEWSVVDAYEAVAREAERTIELYPLRAADALQLGAALVAADGDPGSLEFVTLDRRLADAASREGFPTLGAG
ncbi:MAG TPA: type II toxin-antitoxin system VapC family toxin [Candidatus Binataceae bacterium]|nr:type II toxin-antitoxin system VapC family toxin [Candidatus Binataceae bacterium]